MQYQSNRQRTAVHVAPGTICRDALAVEARRLRPATLKRRILELLDEIAVAFSHGLRKCASFILSDFAERSLTERLTVRYEVTSRDHLFQ